MRVDILSGISRNEGGLLGAVCGLSRTLLDAGVDARIVSHIDGFTNDDLPLWAPIPVELYPARGPLLSSFRLREILKATEANLLHIHGIWLDRQWAALQWQKRTEKPVIISPHGMLDAWAVKNSAWKKKLIGALFANASLRKASCIHALCRSEADSIRAYGLKNPIALIPNGVELPEIGEQKTEVREQKTLLFLGRIHPKKGLKELIEAWGMEQGAWRKDWKLLIAGWDDGNHLAGLKQEASRAGLIWSDVDPSSDPRPPTSVLRPLSSDICFLGPKYGAEKEELLRSVDAFVLPSFSEGLPMSVLEAWAYQLPVVMTDFCNLPEGFEAGAAIRVEPNALSIGQGLKTLTALSNIELQSLGSRGRMLVEEKFTWSRVAQQMASVYEWCVKGGIAPACIEYWSEP